MQLIPYTSDDIELTRALESDPEVMRELGGPHGPDEIEAAHKRRLDAAEGGGWWLKIVPEPDGPAVGAIGIWESEAGGESVHEVGWMVLPSHQGQGIATRALELLLGRAREAGRSRYLHAYPGATNAPSNALCRRFGFELIEQLEVDYAGRDLSVNHWKLELSEPDPA